MVHIVKSIVDGHVYANTPNNSVYASVHNT